MTRIPDFAEEIATALDGSAVPDMSVDGTGGLPSVFAVTDLAVASIAAAGAEVAALSAQSAPVRPALAVDRRLASFWFAWTCGRRAGRSKPLGFGGRRLRDPGRLDPSAYNARIPGRRRAGARPAVGS